MKGSMQTNRWTGYWCMHLHGYDVPADPLFSKALAQPVPVPFKVHPSSPNQRADGIADGLRAHKPPDPLAKAAMDQAITSLEQQKAQGHQAGELLTGGHAPIWYRAQASGFTTARELAKKDSRYRPLADLYADWWAAEIYLCDLLAVPSGPLAHSIIGVGARYDKGLGSNNLTRNVCYRQIKGLSPGVDVKFFRNAEKFQDEVAALLVRDLVKGGALPAPPPSAPPKLAVGLTVERFANGHVSRFTRALAPGDPTTVWVRYSDGAIGEGDASIPGLGSTIMEKSI